MIPCQVSPFTIGCSARAGLGEFANRGRRPMAKRLFLALPISAIVSSLLARSGRQLVPGVRAPTGGTLQYTPLLTSSPPARRRQPPPIPHPPLISPNPSTGAPATPNETASF